MEENVNKTEEIKVEVVEPKVEEVIKEKTTDEIMAKMNDMLNFNEIANLIKNNEQIFELKGVTYRIMKPSYKQRQEVYKKRIEKYTELLKDDRYLLERDLKKIYKKRGIDLDEMDIILQNKMKKRDDFMIKLGGEIKNNANDQTLNILKDEIESINLEIQKLTMEKSSLLEISLEQQLGVFVYTYFVFLLAEKKEGDNWIKVWNTYGEFENGDTELINRLSYFSTLMIGNESI